MTEEIQTDRELRPEPLSVLWRILAAPQTLMVLAALLALVLVLASFIPQIPAQAADDPQAWLATQPGPLGRRGSLITTLGLYDLYHGLWFRLLLALSGLVLFIRLVDAAELAWRAQGRGAPPGSAGFAWEGSAPRVLISSGLPLEEVQERLGSFLERQGYRLTELGGEPPARWLASRWHGLLWLHPLGYAALLVAGAGLILSSYWGWQDEAWRPLQGETRLVGHGTPYTLRFDRFELLQGEQGRLVDYASHVTWLEGTAVVRETVVRARRPASLEGLALREVGYLPTVQVEAWDGAGNPLALEAGGEAQPGAAQVEIRFQEADEQPLLFVPAQERLLALVFEPMCSQGQPVVHIDSMGEGGNGRQRLASLTSSGDVVARDLRLEIELSYGPILRLDHRPGMGLVVAGMGLAVLALLIGWLAPPRLMSLIAEPRAGGGVRVQIAAPPAARVRQWLSQLGMRLQGVLADDD